MADRAESLELISSGFPEFWRAVEIRIELLIVVVSLGIVGFLMVNISRDTSDFQSKNEGFEDDALAVIYTRVSSRIQAEEGYSLEDQAERLKEVAAELGLDFIGPIVDGGESGNNWDREGIKILKHLAEEREITHILVDDVDRLGRSAVETLYFVWRLRRDYGITIVTADGRELDANKITDVMELAMKSIMSDLETDNQSRRANSARVSKIKEDKVWLSWFKEYPVGYRQPAENEWIEPDPSEVEIAQEMYSVFLEIELPGAYGPVADHLNAKYGDYLEDELYGQKVRNLLDRPLYKGIPAPTLKGEDIPIEDENLQLVDEEKWEKAQEKIEKIYIRNSGKGHDAENLEDLTERFGAFEMFQASRKLLQVCEKCGSSSLNYNGTDELEDYPKRIYQYNCTECGNTQKLPNQQEIDDLREFRDQLDELDNTDDSRNKKK